MVGEVLLLVLTSETAYSIRRRIYFLSDFIFLDAEYTNRLVEPRKNRKPTEEQAMRHISPISKLLIIVINENVNIPASGINGATSFLLISLTITYLKSQISYLTSHI